MKKRILAFISAVAVTLAALPSLALPIAADTPTVWDGTTDTLWYNTTDTTFTISTPEQLAGFAYLVNTDGNNFLGKTINLGANIVLNEGDLTNYNGTDTNSWKTWTPIGYYDYDAYENSKPFKGTFDGQHHTISGIYINGNSDYQGLFGYAKNGIIRNIGVVNSYIKGQDNVGGICGFCTHSKIINCYNTGSVNATDCYTGGICGWSEHNSAITNCYNAGAIIGNGVGGICGVMFTDCNITNCYNTGAVSKNDFNGGLDSYGGI